MDKSRHRILVPFLIALGGVLTVLAIAAVWTERQVLDTDEWVTTSSKLLQDDNVQSALQTYLVNELFDNVDVQAEVAAQLPPGRAQLLAGPIKGGLEQLANEVAKRALDSPRVQAAWEQANRTAHELLLNLIEGNGELVQSQGGVVTLNVGALIQQVASQLGVANLADKLPADAGQIEILRSDQLQAAQTAANLVRKLSIVFSLLALGSFGLAIYLAHGRRPRAIFSSGVALIVAGVAIYAFRAAAGQAILDALVKNDAIRPAADSTWSIATSLLTSVATTVIVYGALFIVAAWLASSFAAARATRQFLAPALRDHIAWFYGLVVFAGLLYFALAPTHGVRALLTLLALFALAGFGVAALRRQTAEEFPDAEGFHMPRLRLPSRASEAPTAPLPTAESRLDQLERLAKLREQGVLSDEELAAEKARVLAAAPG